MAILIYKLRLSQFVLYSSQMKLLVAFVIFFFIRIHISVHTVHLMQAGWCILLFQNF